MRISTEKAEAREQRAFKLFCSGHTVNVVQRKLYETDGLQMNVNRIYELRRAAVAGKTFPKRKRKSRKKKERAWSL